MKVLDFRLRFLSINKILHHDIFSFFYWLPTGINTINNSKEDKTGHNAVCKYYGDVFSVQYILNADHSLNVGQREILKS